MSLRDSRTETWRHSDVTVFGLGPLAKPGSRHHITVRFVVV